MTNIVIAEPSVKSLLIQMRIGTKLLSTGTGFIVQGPRGQLLITNRHNVTGRHQETGQPLSKTGGIPDSVAIVHNQRGKLGHWVIREEALFENNNKRWQEHPSLGPSADFVALPLINTDDVEFFPYDPAKPGPEISIGPADIVSVVGFPFGRTGGGALAIWATGFVASEPTLPNAPTFMIDCRSRQGQSGLGGDCLSQRRHGRNGRRGIIRVYRTYHSILGCLQWAHKC